MGSNYQRSIYNQLSEQLELNERLQGENKALRIENSELKKEITRLRSKLAELETNISEKISYYVTEAVRQASEPLVAELNKAHAEISRLKAIINKDSSNSSKPPGSNGFKAVPNSREKSGNPPGGQKGHPGHRLKLPLNTDSLEKQGIVERRVQDHSGGSSEYVSKFTIDVEMKVVITEHRFVKGAPIPGGLHNEVSYGNGLKALTVLLMTEGIVAYKRLREIIGGMTGQVIRLSTGTLNKFHGDFAECLAKSGELDAIKQDLLNGEVMNTDDTSMRVLEKAVYDEEGNCCEPIGYERGEAKSLRATIRTYSNAQSTLYTVNPKKDIQGIQRDGILPSYMGILCHDHESKFYHYGKKNAGCGAHLIRNLKGLTDLYRCRWAEYMRNFVLGMNEHKNKDVSSGASVCAPGQLALYESEYDRLLSEGRHSLESMDNNDWGYNEFKAMLKRLTNFKDSYMLFMRDYQVPFTNNLAERDLRSEKTKEKVCGLFRSWTGIVNHSKIRSFLSTVKKRGKDLSLSIKQAMEYIPVLTG